MFSLSHSLSLSHTNTHAQSLSLSLTRTLSLSLFQSHTHAVSGADAGAGGLGRHAEAPFNSIVLLFLITLFESGEGFRNLLCLMIAGVFEACRCFFVFFITLKPRVE